MTSALDVLITRFLGISSIALLLGNQSVVVSRLSLPSQAPVSLKSADVMFDFCASNLCSFERFTANTDQSAGTSINDHHTLYIFGNVLSERETERSEMDFAGYVPPDCSDRDADTTNNCGPNDSSDAGTRLAI